MGAAHTFLMLAGLLGAGVTGSIALPPPLIARAQPEGAKPMADVFAAATETAPQGQGAARPLAAGVPGAQQAVGASTFNFSVGGYYEQLAGRLNWLPVRLAGSILRTPDAASRLLLVRSAAKQAGLQDVGLSYRDVYGIINAETSWIPRLGASKDGTPNLGIAQFEPATARAVGLTNPADPVQAVHAAALHLKDAALWSARRISGLRLTPEQHATKLREGVSIYYNLSTRGRNQWNGLNTAKLPVETRRHIANARDGAREAAELEAQLRQLQARMHGEPMVTAQNLRSR